MSKQKKKLAAKKQPQRVLRINAKYGFSGLVYCQDLKEIHGEVNGNDPPHEIYGLAWDDGSAAPPTAPEGAVCIPWAKAGHTVGPFVISDFSWPNSGTISAAIWAVSHAASGVPVEICGSGSGSGGHIATAREQHVQDTAARAYHVEVSGFKSKGTKAFNGGWDLRLKRAGARWTNGGDGIDRPRVVLQLKSIVSGFVVCTIKLRKTVVVYRLPAAKWKPLAASKLRYARSAGLASTMSFPKSITVRPA